MLSAFLWVYIIVFIIGIVAFIIEIVCIRIFFITIREKIYFILATVLWPVSLVVVFIISSLIFFFTCVDNYRNRGLRFQTFSPKIVTRLPLKYCISTHECTICLEPFTLQSDCVSDASTSDCRSEPQQPTDSTNPVPQSPVISDSTSIVLGTSDAAGSDYATVSNTNDVKFSKRTNCGLQLHDHATCMTSCGHCFHYKCLVQSLKRQRKCPNCRQYIDLRCCYALLPAETEVNRMGDKRVNQTTDSITNMFTTRIGMDIFLYG